MPRIVISRNKDLQVFIVVIPETKRIAVINNADAEEKTDLYIKGHLIDSLTLAPREMRWVDDAE